MACIIMMVHVLTAVAKLNIDGHCTNPSYCESITTNCFEQCACVVARLTPRNIVDSVC